MIFENINSACFSLKNSNIKNKIAIFFEDSIFSNCNYNSCINCTDIKYFVQNRVCSFKTLNYIELSTNLDIQGQIIDSSIASGTKAINIESSMFQQYKSNLKLSANNISFNSKEKETCFATSDVNMKIEYSTYSNNTSLENIGIVCSSRAVPSSNTVTISLSNILNNKCDRGLISFGTKTNEIFDSIIIKNEITNCQNSQIFYFYFAEHTSFTVKHSIISPFSCTNDQYGPNYCYTDEIKTDTFDLKLYHLNVSPCQANNSIVYFLSAKPRILCTKAMHDGYFHFCLSSFTLIFYLE